MAQQCVIAGVVFNDVPAVDIPDSNNVLHSFLDTTIATNAASASDIANGKLAYVNGSLVTGTSSGGGGIGTLLKTQALGTLNVTSTSAVDLSKSFTVSDINNYDLLIVVASANPQTNGYHVATATNIWLYNSSTNLSTKTNARISGHNNNYYSTSGGSLRSIAYSVKYGIYPNSASISSGQVTLSMYGRQNNTYTKTINGNYTAYVYGINILDLL